MMMAEEADLIRRATGAYWRRLDGEKCIRMQPSKDSALEEVNGRHYLVLRSGSDVLAVYRVDNRGKLRWLKRWPSELEEW